MHVYGDYRHIEKNALICRSLVRLRNCGTSAYLTTSTDHELLQVANVANKRQTSPWSDPTSQADGSPQKST